MKITNGEKQKMRILEPKSEIVPQAPGLEGVYEMIEKAGRNCYQSEPTEGVTSEDFVNKLIKMDHGAMLEHGTMYFDVPLGRIADDSEYMWKTTIIQFFKHNKYSVVKKYRKLHRIDSGSLLSLDHYAITTNYRVFVEQIPWDDLGPMRRSKVEGWELGLDKDYVLSFLCEPNEHHEKRITVKFVTDRGVSAELNRHRTHSIAEQSTRYCNYSKDKFGSEIAVIANDDVKEDNLYGLLGVPYSGVRKDLTAAYVWEYANKTAQWAYMTLIDLFGWSPQQARRVLPLDTATTIYHTAFESDWKDFMDKRWAGTTGKPHPDMLLITKQLKELLNYKNDED